ncbi:hypothetical protein MJO29_003342 [Puccinia striiformis f. sp. tritici]|nr:hypothetical protein MJO29_003342 [Puccinia striiformis f. sp. tritici]
MFIVGGVRVAPPSLGVITQHVVAPIEGIPMANSAQPYHIIRESPPSGCNAICHLCIYLQIKSSSILLQPLRQRIRHGTYPYSNKARSIALAASNSEFLSTRCLRLFKASFIVDTA